MKKIKIKYVGLWSYFKPEESVFHQILKKYYEPIICDDPDYIICGCFEPFYEYLNYPQVRIMLCGENYIPDFNFVDYAICRYPIKFLDRCFYEPGCLRPYPNCFDLKKPRCFLKKDLDGKKFFCNFIYSHESENHERSEYFNVISKYKRVDSVGTFLNNTGFIVDRHDGTKQNFQKKCKFTLCIESTKNEGFFSEKLTDAFLTNTIPIYFGSSTVKEIFNKKSFIDISDYDSIESLMNRIIEIDNNDDLYLSIINEPVLNDVDLIDKLYKSECGFVKHIFEQDLAKAFRRSRIYIPHETERYIFSLKNKVLKKHKGCIKRVLNKILHHC